MIGVIFNDHRMASRRSRTRRDKRAPWQDQDDDNQAAQRMGAHSTQAQTAAYIRNKKAIKSTATR